ncbi:acrosomal protein SP-10-like isoform X2 [Ochotona princeps]|uniref:acrosomal protein SP-10-like isoform X2 n=1 Tax=Ochotona princeps TaxID=9978 RepID=UPI0027155263|nr:acrosomal protein SP-10-like isoform X2 [Ochotona princeps]
MDKFIFLMGLYLLGSARGRPVEPPGSMDQAGTHQLTGDDFSLGNPSGSEALYETSGENSLIEHGSSEHSTSEHTSGEHAVSEHTGEHASGEQPAGEKSAVDTAAGEHASGEQAVTSSEHASGDQAATSGEHSSGEQAAASGEQASPDKSLSEQPSAVPVSSTSPGAVLNCNTCAYMNDQGKCLRGEGVCTTQNSQQCMLKKIFEGGKLQFMVQGCENMCPSMNLFSHGTRMQIICCRHQSFCNKI